MARTVATEALLLRSVDYGEADRIVTLLTRDLGRLSAMAKGARRSQRRFGAALEPFGVIAVEVAPGRGEVGRLAAANLVRPFPTLLGDLARLSLAGRLLERVREAVPAGPVDARIYDACVDALAAIDAAGAPVTELEVAFTARLCALLGVAPRVDRCAVCDVAAPEGRAALFDPRRTGVVCRACGGGPLRLSGRARAVLGAAATGGWAEIGAVAWGEQVQAEVRRVLDAVLAAHVRTR
jgi:DNA repair protein RecO (recombination protein O)